MTGGYGGDKMVLYSGPCGPMARQLKKTTRIGTQRDKSPSLLEVSVESAV